MEKKNWIVHVLAVIMIIPCLIFGLAAVVIPAIHIEHYRRVYQNPLTVTATVTRHASYDDDGDTDYRSYISYTANGVDYTNISFEDEDTKAELTAVGEQVIVEVSPEDPTALISELKSRGSMLIFTLPICLILLTLLWGAGIKSRRSKTLRGTPDRETIQKDALLTIYGRFSLPGWLLFCVGYLFLYWRYPTAVQTWVAFVAVASGVIWLWCVYAAIRDVKYVKNDAYKLHHDVLIRKEMKSGSDENIYKLYYKSAEKTWSRVTSEKYYYAAKEGAAVLAVYLPGKKEPILHYDTDGNAC